MHVDNSSAVLPRTSIQRWVWGAFALLFVAIIVATVALIPFPAQAGVQQAIAEFISWVLSAIVSVLGKLLLVAVYLLTLIAQYNDFVNAAPVVNGWVIVRDVGNMFFIIVLLIIAFATILNIPNYQWKALLPKLVIAAILINFSKTIAGLLIDFSQVIMLTFVNGFAAAAGGNFAQMYKIRELVSINPGYEGDVDLLAILGGYFLAFVMLAIALATTLIMAVILAFRIVMLWALVVLSPLPYVLNLLPQGKKYGDKWWSMFGEYLTVGPVLAFFLWLALVSVGSGEVKGFTGTGAAGSSTAELTEYESSTSAVATEAGKPESLLGFVISICMLIAGLKITGEMGVIGAGAAKGALGKMEGMAKWGAKKFTGYRYAAERVSGAMAMHETARKEKAQAGAAKLYGAYGTALAAPGNAARWAGKKMKLDKAAAAAGDAFAKVPGAKYLQFQRNAQQARKEATDLRQKGDFEGAKKAETRARRWERGSAAAGYAWKAGMVAAAPVTGGASLLGLAPAAIRQAQKGGTAAQTAAKDYKYKEVSKALDAMKDTKKDEVLKTMRGEKPGATTHERAAAFLRATKEGWLESNEVAGGEDFLQSLGADDKTKSTFKSYAEQKYAGTMVSGDERRKRIEAGTMPTKDLNPEELSRGDGALASDFVLHGTPEQRKELGKSRALKDAYKAGLKAAANKEGDPEKKQKLQSELMRLGPDKATGQTALQHSGMDLAALGKALQGETSSELIANLDEKDLTDDVLKVIAQNVNAARLTAAVGQAKKPDADPQAQVNIAALQAALRKTGNAQGQEKSHAKVRGAEGQLSKLRGTFDKLSAAAARGDAAAQAGLAGSEADWKQAQKDLEDAITAYEKEMDDAGITRNERNLYEAMKKPKAKK